MTAPHAEQLIEGYLARLRVAAFDLAPNVRNELVEDMRAHIAEARAREPEETDATILNILDRLGEPDVLVAEARPRSSVPLPSPSQEELSPYRPGGLEIAAVLLLPFVWIVGVILLWLSPAWTTRDKVLGTALTLGGYPGILLILLVRRARGWHPGAPIGSAPWDLIGGILSLTAIVILLLLPVIMVAYLAARLRWGRPAQTAAA